MSSLNSKLIFKEKPVLIYLLWSAEVVSKQQLLRDAQSNLEAAQNNAKNTEDRWIVRQKQNTDLIQEYRDQLAVISQAETQL